MGRQPCELTSRFDSGHIWAKDMQEGKEYHGSVSLSVFKVLNGITSYRKRWDNVWKTCDPHPKAVMRPVEV